MLTKIVLIVQLSFVIVYDIVTWFKTGDITALQTTTINNGDSLGVVVEPLLNHAPLSYIEEYLLQTLDLLSIDLVLIPNQFKVGLSAAIFYSGSYFFLRGKMPSGDINAIVFIPYIVEECVNLVKDLGSKVKEYFLRFYTQLAEWFLDTAAFLEECNKTMVVVGLSYYIDKIKVYTLTFKVEKLNTLNITTKKKKSILIHAIYTKLHELKDLELFINSKVLKLELELGTQDGSILIGPGLKGKIYISHPYRTILYDYLAQKICNRLITLHKENPTKDIQFSYDYFTWLLDTDLNNPHNTSDIKRMWEKTLLVNGVYDIVERRKKIIKKMNKRWWQWWK